MVLNEGTFHEGLVFSASIKLWAMFLQLSTESNDKITSLGVITDTFVKSERHK